MGGSVVGAVRAIVTLQGLMQCLAVIRMAFLSEVPRVDTVSHGVAAVVGSECRVTIESILVEVIIGV